MGAEGRNFTRVTKNTEYYLGENRGNIYDISHLAIDNGADLIIGHGPHVPRAIESYKNKMIIYSLGNFWVYGPFLLNEELGMLPLIQIKLNQEGEWLEGEIISGTMEKRGAWKIDNFNKAANKIKELTELDGFNKNITWINNKFYPRD